MSCRRTSSSASSLRRDRPCCALLGDQLEQLADLGARRQAQLVAAERAARPALRRAPRATASARSARAVERERVERPRLGRAAEAVDRARRAVGRRARRGAATRVAPELARDRQPPKRVAEGRRRAGTRGESTAPRGSSSRRAAERLEQSELGEPPPPVRRRAARSSSRIRSPGGPRDQRRLLPDEPLGRAARSGSRARPRAGPRAAGAAGRRSKTLGRDRAHDAAPRGRSRPSNGSTVLAAGERPGDRVDREVAAREVVLDRAARSGVKSTVRPSLERRPASRRASRERETARRRRASRSARAARSGSRQAMSRSTTRRPSSSSRTAPPTTQASSPASTSRDAVSSIDDRPPRRASGPSSIPQTSS